MKLKNIQGFIYCNWASNARNKTENPFSLQGCAIMTTADWRLPEYCLKTATAWKIPDDVPLLLDYFISSTITGSQSWNRRHNGQTIHPIEKLISMNLFKILCVVTWTWLFLSSMVMEAVRDQKRYSERLVHPTVPVILTKIIKK